MAKSIAEIRAELLQLGNISHTSYAFQDDILRAIETEKDRGGCVIEVGCYRGGLTAQIAAVCRTWQKHFYVVDVSTKYLSIAKNTVSGVLEHDDTTYFIGDLMEFYESEILVHDPILVFVDGDHRYANVVKDITAILTSERPPYAVAFHDFSLRYAIQALADNRVDRAIFDTLGTTVHPHHLGETAGVGQTLQIVAQADGHYHEVGQPEGILLLYEEMRAAAQCHQHSSAPHYSAGSVTSVSGMSKTIRFDVSIDQWKHYIRHYKWRDGDIDPMFLENVPTMLTVGERQLLHWLAREMPIDKDNCIVEAGAFIGGSTVSLASGLSLNSRLDDNYFIYTYDLFRAPRDEFSRSFIGAGKKVGDNVLDLFCKNVERYMQNLIIIAGDFLFLPPPRRNIDILFIDIAKAWELNDHIITEFFPLLVPGRSIVIQRDFNDHSLPWVKLTMFYFADYFEHLCDDESSRIFLCSKPIPPEMLHPLKSQMTYEDMRQLFMVGIQKEANDFSRYYMRMSLGWLIFEFEGLTPAVSYLSSVPKPWEWCQRNVQSVIEYMKYFRDNEGLRRWSAAMFEAH